MAAQPEQEPVQPTKPGWYVVLEPDFDQPTVRAFGKDGLWWIPLGRGNGDDGWMSGRAYKNWVGPIASIEDEQPFRATPPAAQRKPLTDEEIKAVIQSIDPDEEYLPKALRQFARAIEAAHGIKEQS
jgi:hypothetical protein